MKSIILGAAPLVNPQTLVNGQQVYDVRGTYIFTVPDGVHSVCFAMVGAGQHGIIATRMTGKGGDLRYMNDVKVKPGDKIAVVVGWPEFDSGRTQAFGIKTDAPLSATVLGADGSPGQHSPGTGQIKGGNAGNYYSGDLIRRGAGFNLATFTGIPATKDAGLTGAAPGGGGGLYLAYTQSYKGADGAVRIIWGPDRAFPDKKIGNL
jgi:hypothetical protein